MSAEGVLRFGRYAFPPNRLGYCGPDDSERLLGYVTTGRADQGAAELGRRFEGAYPYLCLIAAANGIADPFDVRVVEAYWIGNGLLENVGVRDFHDSMRERFGSRVPPREFRWLAEKVGAGATPHHNFHVFEVYSRAGLLKGEGAEPVLEVMDSCRISWGRVEAVSAGHVVVSRRPLELSGGSIRLGAPREVRLETYGGELAPGSIVSAHWGWACEPLTPARLSRLSRATVEAVGRFNLTEIDAQVLPELTNADLSRHVAHGSTIPSKARLPELRRGRISYHRPPQRLARNL